MSELMTSHSRQMATAAYQNGRTHFHLDGNEHKPPLDGRKAVGKYGTARPGGASSPSKLRAMLDERPQEQPWSHRAARPSATAGRPARNVHYSDENSWGASRPTHHGVSRLPPRDSCQDVVPPRYHLHDPASSTYRHDTEYRLPQQDCTATVLNMRKHHGIVPKDSLSLVSNRRKIESARMQKKEGSQSYYGRRYLSSNVATIAESYEPTTVGMISKPTSREQNGDEDMVKGVTRYSRLYSSSAAPRGVLNSSSTMHHPHHDKGPGTKDKPSRMPLPIWRLPKNADK